jgi:LacI family transcriptional regulator
VHDSSNPPLRPKQRSRLIDVANHAGVTKSVVSRVLNNDGTLSIREETRVRILEAVRDLDYQPHTGARALAGASTRALALLIPDLTNPVYSRITRGAVLQARARGFAMLLAEDAADFGVDRQFADLVASHRVDGLLIASARPDHPLLKVLPDSQIPHVFVNRVVAGSGRNISLDLEAASCAALDHLAALGHRWIGHVSGPEDLTPSRSRRAGLLRAARRAGIPEPSIESGDFNEQGGFEAATRLLRNHPDLTAVYASTLNQAIGVLSAVHAAGLRVPQDISVISYDDLPLAGFLQPPLTAIAMPLMELGQAAVDALCGQLEGAPPENVMVPGSPEVIIRASTGPPPPLARAGRAGIPS